MLLRPNDNLDTRYLCQAIDKAQANLINFFAPAECTVSALYLKLEAVDTHVPQMVPVGRCLPGCKVALLDDYGQQVIPNGRRHFQRLSNN